jgi:septal ring factor EnvC (AmiA/AmiB activator)
MRKLIVILLCFSFTGCALLPGGRKPKEQIQQLEQSILEKEQQIEKLSAMLKDAESKLAEKEAKIADLQKKLENFGVFE